MPGSYRGNEVAKPAEQSTGPYPEARRDDQPEQSAEKVSIVELTDARNDKTEYCGTPRLRHATLLLHLKRITLHT